MRENISWMFFNCDALASNESIKPAYNPIVYRKRAGRRALWRKINEEINENSINIENKDIPKVRKAVLEGNPVEANEYMMYGFILTLEEAA